MQCALPAVHWWWEQEGTLAEHPAPDGQMKRHIPASVFTHNMNMTHLIWKTGCKNCWIYSTALARRAIWWEASSIQGQLDYTVIHHRLAQHELLIWGLEQHHAVDDMTLNQTRHHLNQPCLCYLISWGRSICSLPGISHWSKSRAYFCVMHNLQGTFEEAWWNLESVKPI